MTRRFHVDRSGRLFVDGRWVAIIETEADPVGHTYARQRVRLLGVTVDVPFDTKVEVRDDMTAEARIAEARHVTVTHSNAHVDLDEWERLNAINAAGCEACPVTGCLWDGRGTDAGAGPSACAPGGPPPGCEIAEPL